MHGAGSLLSCVILQLAKEKNNLIVSCTHLEDGDDDDAADDDDVVVLAVLCCYYYLDTLIACDAAQTY